MRVRLICNPISGRRSTSEVVERLETLLRARGCHLETMNTAGPGDATRLAAEAPQDTRAVVVAGGDGTVREVVEGLIGRPTPIVILPGGTENVLARHFGFRVTPDAVASAVLEGREMAYDVGVCGDRKFILMVGVGFDAEVVRGVTLARRGHISYWSYVGPTWRALVHYRAPEVVVEVDGEAVFMGHALVWAGIIPRYALGTKLLAKARTDDGLLDVAILPCSSRTRLVFHSVRILLGWHLAARGAQYHQCGQVLVRSVDGSVGPVQVDGDFAGSLPVECHVIPAGVRLLLPPSDAVRPSRA